MKKRNKSQKRKALLIFAALFIVSSIVFTVSISNFYRTYQYTSLIDIGMTLPEGMILNQTDGTMVVIDNGNDYLYFLNADGSNGSVGFSLSNLDIVTPKGIAEDPDDYMFWIVDSGNDFVYHVNREGVNQTGGFSTAAAGETAPYAIRIDPSDDSFWVLGAGNAFMYHFNTAGVNQSDGFSISAAGASSPQVMHFNTSDGSFWVFDNLDRFVYHFNSSGDNQSDGFDTDVYGITTITDILINDTDGSFILLDANDVMIYIANSTGWVNMSGYSALHVESGLTMDSGSLEKNDNSMWMTDDTSNFVYHFDASGDNQTDGFSTVASGNGNANPRAIAFDHTDNTIWVSDSVDDFVYHYNSAGTNISGGFKISPSGADDGNVFGIVVASDGTFWLLDNQDEFAYHLDTNGANMSDGISMTPITSGNMKGIEMDPNGDGIWVAVYSDQFVYHVAFNGTNMSNGFNTRRYASSYFPITLDINEPDIYIYADEDDFVHHFYFDETPPIFTDYPDQSLYDNESLYVDINATDSFYGVGTFGINWTTQFTINPTTGVLTNSSPFGGSVEYYINVTVNDTVSNLNSTILLVNITGTDSGPPTVSLVAPTNYQNLSSSSVTFTFNASDESGLDTCQLWTNTTGTWHNNYSWVGPTSGVENSTTVLNVQDGTHKYSVWCNDSNGYSNFSSDGNLTFSVDTVKPNMTIVSPVNDSSYASTVLITLGYNVSDDNLKSCYFTLRTTGGALNNYLENTSLSCTDVTRTIQSLYYETFVVQLWGEDYAGNLGDANLTWTSYTSTGGGGGGGGGGATVLEDEEEEEKSFCGDGICQSILEGYPTGNDYGIIEDWYTCNQDCPGVNIDEGIFSFTKYCLDGDPTTHCIFSSLFSIGGVGNVTTAVCGDGICTSLENPFNCQNDCGKFSIKSFTGCLDDSEDTYCIFKSNISYVFFFILISFGLTYSTVKIKSPGSEKKISLNKYIKIKLRKRRR